MMPMALVSVLLLSVRPRTSCLRMRKITDFMERRRGKNGNRIDVPEKHLKRETEDRTYEARPRALLNSVPVGA